MAPNPIRDYVFSMLRTGVPVVIATILGWATENFGPVIDEDTKAQLAAAAYALAAIIYYGLVRLAETYISPKFSFLLGDFRKGQTAPVYPDENNTVVVPPATGGNQ